MVNSKTNIQIVPNPK